MGLSGHACGEPDLLIDFLVEVVPEAEAELVDDSGVGPGIANRIAVIIPPRVAMLIDGHQCRVTKIVPHPFNEHVHGRIQLLDQRDRIADQAWSAVKRAFIAAVPVMEIDVEESFPPAAEIVGAQQVQRIPVLSQLKVTRIDCTFQMAKVLIREAEIQVVGRLPPPAHSDEVSSGATSTQPVVVSVGVVNRAIGADGGSSFRGIRSQVGDA